MSAFGRSIVRATPRGLLMSLMLDVMWAMLFQPQGSTEVLIYIIFLPGFDLVSAVISLFNYIKDNKPVVN